MHEVSIAFSLLDQVRPHVPDGHKLLSIKVEAGPYQSIEPSAMEMAWTAVTDKTDFSTSRVIVISLPYQLTCTACQRQFTSQNIFAPCQCGSSDTIPDGRRDLRLVSLEVE